MRKSGYYFVCHHDNGKGGFDADYSCCGKSSKSYPTLDKAIEGATRHAGKHGYEGWGYSPQDWSPSIAILRVDKLWREHRVGYLSDIIGDKK